MKWPAIALTITTSSLIGASLAIGLMLIIEPWSDEDGGSDEVEARSETEAKILMDRWATAVLGSPGCQTLERGSDGWFFECSQASSLRTDRSVIMRVPDDDPNPLLLECTPTAWCEERNFFPVE